MEKNPRINSFPPVNENKIYIMLYKSFQKILDSDQKIRNFFFSWRLEVGRAYASENKKSLH